MLHWTVSLTETELCIEYLHVIDKALEMPIREWHGEETSGSFIPLISMDAQAQP